MNSFPVPHAIRTLITVVTICSHTPASHAETEIQTLNRVARERQSSKTRRKQEIRSAFNQFWYAAGRLNWKGIESRVRFPLAQMSVRRSRYGSQTVILHNSRQLRRNFMGIQEYIDAGLKGEIMSIRGMQQISDVRITEDGLGSANISFTYKVGEKIPYNLVTSMSKIRGRWKVVFTQVPS